MDEGKTIRWIKGVPPDKPVCGYSGELCVEGEIEVSYQAAKSVTFDLLILEIKFLFFKNTVNKQFTIFVNHNTLSLSKQQHLC